MNHVYANVASQQLTTQLENIHTMQAVFNQQVIDKNGKLIQKSTGKMALQRPGKFRWEVTHPLSQLIVTNSSRLWIFDPDLDQVTIRSLSKEAGETPALLLSNRTITLTKDFRVTMKGSSFLLQPKNNDSMFAEIEMNFVNNEIRDMILRDHLGQTTQIQFSHVVLNKAISSALFVFKIPPHVDVIDETR
jgi:outer membrane lipoprotein carrier protein